MVNSLKVFSLNSLDTINNVADVNVSYDSFKADNILLAMISRDP